MGQLVDGTTTNREFARASPQWKYMALVSAGSEEGFFVKRRQAPPGRWDGTIFGAIGVRADAASQSTPAMVFRLGNSGGEPFAG